ncbi:hypothetical protein CCR75_007089 [Bremia lactucae]|uniref:Uncharacterized protein n=1 Tax=Bremia lactucae TaxID=4779 RepID=A0A976FGF6_BRELC|nr:hypothetical protein CCR75_007089 [Bremia lactucae]
MWSSSFTSLAENVQLPGIVVCPHCNQGYGRASLSIHVRRCRTLLSHTAQEAAEHKRLSKSMQNKPPPSLVDLCLRHITKHFDSICMDKIMAFPKEANVIATLPQHLLRRMVVGLVKDRKRGELENRACRVRMKKLERELKEARRDLVQLDSARIRAARSHAKMVEQKQISKQLQRELDCAKAALALAEREKQKLQAKRKCDKTTRLGYEAQINSLRAAKNGFKKASIEAHRREVEAARPFKLTKNALGSSNVPFQRPTRHQKVSARVQKTEASVHPTPSLKLIDHAQPHGAGRKSPIPTTRKKITKVCRNNTTTIVISTFCNKSRLTRWIVILPMYLKDLKIVIRCLSHQHSNA